MNRILKRPMFRIGGPTSEGITSGLDMDRSKMASGDMDMKMEQLREAFLNYKERGGTLSFEEFSRLYAEENFNSGGRAGYQNGGFSMSGLPGFLTQFGLNLLSTPPQGNIFQTSAVAAQEPFKNLQASQEAMARSASDRAFQRELLQEELKGKKEIQAMKNKEQFFAAQTPEEQFRERLKVYGESTIPVIKNNATDIANFEVKHRDQNYVQLDFSYNNKSKQFEPDFRGIPDGALTYNPIDGLAYRNQGGQFIKLNPFTLKRLDDVDGTE
jgi:hypothetical protein